MKYRDYTCLDFVQDQYFLDWVQNPTMDSERFWVEWIKQNPEKQKVILLAKAFASSIRYDKEYEPDERSVLEMNENIIRFNNNQHYIAPKSRSTSIYFGSAAAIIMVVVSLVSWLNWSATKQVLEQPVEMITKSTPEGAKMKLVLPDGTRISLNAATSITYPARFINHERVVHLTGEAYFDVQPDPEHPFIILTENLETRVLGTSFNISVYPGDKVNKVAVSHGMVKVLGQSGEQIELSANEMAILNLEKQTIRRGLFIPQEESGWKDGVLYFRDVPLHVVFSRLEKWFGVKIHCAKGVRLTDNYSGEYTNETLENILKGISYTSGLDYSIGYEYISITPGKEVNRE